MNNLFVAIVILLLARLGIGVFDGAVNIYGDLDTFSWQAFLHRTFHFAWGFAVAILIFRKV